MLDFPCDDCGQQFAGELVLPRADWLRVNPQDGGILCPSCIWGRVRPFSDTINVTGRITSSDDSFEVYRAMTDQLPGELRDEEVEAMARAMVEHIWEPSFPVAMHELEGDNSAGLDFMQLARVAYAALAGYRARDEQVEALAPAKLGMEPLG